MLYFIFIFLPIVTVSLVYIYIHFLLCDIVRLEVDILKLTINSVALAIGGWWIWHS